ncbi:unnamed protein product [Porites lobata]|uniref:Uncharacterized protein n=1 Tax=Porites lobata TaxID=104759 RepID=A0ABN8NCE0_9CNID|nr:unnamed protein product [Porites lobata]
MRPLTMQKIQNVWSTKFFAEPSRVKKVMIKLFFRPVLSLRVMILESAESKCIALGVVFEDVGTQLSLGKEGTVGYHTKDARIHDSSSESGNITIVMYIVALRGNVIRCTVVFEKEQEVDGKIQVPVVFSVNGGRIDPIDKHQSFIEYSED